MTKGNYQLIQSQVTDFSVEYAQSMFLFLQVTSLSILNEKLHYIFNKIQRYLFGAIHSRINSKFFIGTSSNCFDLRFCNLFSVSISLIFYWIRYSLPLPTIFLARDAIYTDNNYLVFISTSILFYSKSFHEIQLFYSNALKIRFLNFTSLYIAPSFVYIFRNIASY